MNTNQRLNNLEQVAKPQTKREPLLVEFVGSSDELQDDAGILYVYDNTLANPSEPFGIKAGTYHLTKEQLREYTERGTIPKPNPTPH